MHLFSPFAIVVIDHDLIKSIEEIINDLNAMGGHIKVLPSCEFHE